MSDNKQSGFDIDLGNQCSKKAYSWAKKTFPNRDHKTGALSRDLEGGFSNLLDFNGQKLGIASDGIGTKIELAERTKNYRTLGYDLVAMVADDLAAAGFVPTNLSNILDVDHLDYDAIDALMEGLHDACNFSEIAVTGGEIAELGNRISGFGDGMHFNWCSTAIGILHPTLERPFTAENLQAGDHIIAIRSRGFRSNGFSAIRRIMEGKFGSDWHTQKYKDSTWGEALLQPSLIFSPAIAQILESGKQIKAVAHVTGGGIADNLSRAVKGKQLGAQLDNLFPPHEIMTDLLELGNLSLEQAYLYWNMGNGMLLLVNESESAALCHSFTENKNYQLQVVGKLISEPVIEIKTPSFEKRYSY